MALPLVDKFDSDTTAGYTKNGTWTWSSVTKDVAGSISAATGYLIKDTGVSDNLTAICSIVVNSGLTTDSNEWAGLCVGSSNTTGAMFGLVFRGASGGDFTHIWLIDNGVAWVTSANFTWVVGRKYWFKIYRNGTNVKCKVWADGLGEPLDWNIDTTVTSHTQTYAGFSINSSASVSVNIDDLCVDNGLIPRTGLIPNNFQFIKGGDGLSFSERIR